MNERSWKRVARQSLEEGGQRVFWEVVGHELHGVCADDGDVLVRAKCCGGLVVGRQRLFCTRYTKCRETILNILGDLYAYLHT